MSGRYKRVLVAAAIAATGGVAMASPVDAGEEGDVEVDIVFSGIDAAAVRDAVDVEFYEMPGGTLISPIDCSGVPTVGSNSFAAAELYDCDLPDSGPDYALGLTGVPEGWSVTVDCTDGAQFPNERLDDPGAEFSYYFDFPARCDVLVRQALIVLDKEIVGTEAPAPTSDFTLEVYSDGTEVATATDPSDGICDNWDDVDLGTVCTVVGVEPGVYALGEVPVTGYEYVGVECTPISPLNSVGSDDSEQFDDPGATVDLTETDVYCAIVNTYAEGQLVVTASVNNDDGGTAGVEDVSIEVYEDGVEAPVVAATPCAADGSCLDTMLPVGDYVIGYEGPDGYTHEVAQTVTAPSTTTTSTLVNGTVVPEAMLDDAEAEFTIENGGLVEIEVAIDDPAPEPTTTTTEPATTTTAFDAGAGTLPPTGASSETNTTLAVSALALIAAGLALVGVRRRTA